MMRAEELGVQGQFLDALRTDVRAMCVGPVTAQPLTRLGIPTSSPDRMRLGALARHIADELPLLRSRTVQAAGHVIEIRGTCVVVDGEVRPLSRAGMAILRALANVRARSCPAAICCARSQAVAPTPMRWIRQCCDCELR
ncbi:response regulator [Mycobacterium xenopi 4042]|uniref:Response regulator n=1 Tax=Mycobacterium xenopi 4042 TaxID=1299334 RepID=X7Z9H6_MYCXE|nr:response regulator [Mycobacterium xenopi 4042]